MSVNKKTYSEMAKKASPPTPKFRNEALAFICGGAICTLGQALLELYKLTGMSADNCKTAVSVTLVAITAVLTALHVWDDFAKFAGAGAFVPITGFANAVVSPAIEFKSEGQVLGLGAKMFTIAGPVILYGTVASSVFGIIYYIVRLCQGVA